jgi:predicted oxidoreductase
MMRVQALQDALAAQPVSLDDESWTELWQAGAGHPVP